jgi:hypothetical protein
MSSSAASCSTCCLWAFIAFAITASWATAVVWPSWRSVASCVYKPGPPQCSFHQSVPIGCTLPSSPGGRYRSVPFAPGVPWCVSHYWQPCLSVRHSCGAIPHDRHRLLSSEIQKDYLPRALLGRPGVACLPRTSVPLFSLVRESWAESRLLSHAAPGHRACGSCPSEVRVCCLAVPPPQTNSIAPRLWCGFVQYGSLQRRLSALAVSLQVLLPTSQRTLSIGRRSSC